MKIEFDPIKRGATLQARGLDFADAGVVFAARTITVRDARHDYGEARYITVGALRDKIVVMVWTPRDQARRIISMRHANDKETGFYRATI